MSAMVLRSFTAPALHHDGELYADAIRYGGGCY